MTTSRHAPDLDRTLEDERLRPFLPLVYTAWSDGELNAEEIEAVCSIVASFSGIDEDCLVALRRWLDPAHPPSPADLESLRRRVVEWAAATDIDATPDVADLGLAIAEVSRHDGNVSSDERAALQDVDKRLGPLRAGPELTGKPIRLADITRRPTAFQADALAAALDGRHGETRTRMRTLLSRPEFAYPADDIATATYRELVLSWTQILADDGLGGLAFPEPYGAADPSAFVAAFSVLGHHDISLLTKVGVQFGLFGGSIARLGTDHHHRRYLSDAASLALPGCFAMTETAHGSNVRDIETTAVYDKATDELIITTPHDLARKDYIGNAAAHGRMAVVFARLIVDGTDHGIHAVLVPIRDESGNVHPGIRIQDNDAKGGLEGVDNGRIWFDGVRVARTELLDRFASIRPEGTYSSDIPNPDRRFFTTIGTLVGGRIAVGAASVSLAKSALTIAIRYAHRRRQFGPAPGAETLLIDYPLHRRRLIPRLAKTYALHFAFERLIELYAQETLDQRRLEARAAGLKAISSWHALDTLQAAREACGGQGYLAVNRLVAMRADADVFATYEGDNTVLVQLVARGLLSDFRQQFESMNPLGLVRYLAGRVGDALTEANPIVRSTTDPAELTDATWQLDQLERRTHHQVETLARRLKKRTDAGMDPFEAFAAVQPHADAAARSSIAHHVLEAFDNAVKQIEPGAVRDVLDRLRGLHGLAELKADLGWLQQHNQISASTAHAIGKTHDRLIGGIAADSLALVDAFAIPDSVLGAPIALYNEEEVTT